MTPDRPSRSRRMAGTVWVCCHAVSEPRLSLFFTGCGSNTTCTCTCRPHTSPLRHTSRPPRTMPCAAPPSHCWSTALWGTAPRSSPPCRTPGIPSPQPPNWDGAFEEERRGDEGEGCEFVVVRRWMGTGGAWFSRALPCLTCMLTADRRTSAECPRMATKARRRRRMWAEELIGSVEKSSHCFST